MQLNPASRLQAHYITSRDASQEHYGKYKSRDGGFANQASLAQGGEKVLENGRQRLSMWVFRA
jgi:hypothetical protein